ncbi:S8 family peptidase, partial [bacterium]|nr:S8 family peptidase [candidate division CSSED10-310 bacterium]
SLQIKPLRLSKWLNAASAFLSESQINSIKDFRFISKIQPVSQYIRKDHEESLHKRSLQPARYNNIYGRSFIQNNLMRVPEIHEIGINGTGVLIGLLDSGFNYKAHEAFSHITVIAEYDFVNNDSVTANEADDNDVSSQHSHGTKVLSVIAGYKEHELVGPAFGAEYLLGKTEDVRSETVVEEDNWVAGIEWMENLGADIVSSSLGYNDWYTYEDMDGNTAITTIAADIAVEKGVIVVNSLGNEGNNSWRHMIAPADARGVISVGSVDQNGILSSFSSFGPTYDDRIKPDVVAMGTNVYVATPSTTDQYTFANGTSLACPLVAGAAALLLCVNPELTPHQVMELLKNTAANSDTPDNSYGWGLINVYEAIFAMNPEFPSNFILYDNYPNPLNNSTVITYRLLKDGDVSLKIFNLNGQTIQILTDSYQPTGTYQFRWNGKNNEAKDVASGIYFYQLKLDNSTAVKKMMFIK